MRFSIITPTLQRDSLAQCCDSVNIQTHKDWEHIVVFDGGPVYEVTLDDIAHPNRTIICLPTLCANSGNTPRHIGWKLATGDWVIYLDDDNWMTDSVALERIATALKDHAEHWAIFPILRFGQRFFRDPPGLCQTDSANMVIKREIAQWPNIPDYTADGLFCESLRDKYSYAAFPEVTPIIVVPTQGRGQ